MHVCLVCNQARIAFCRSGPLYICRYCMYASLMSFMCST